MSANDVEFVPFSIEAGGAWGPAARKFFVECLKLADGDRDVDLYHWSSAKFSSTWYDTLSVLVAKGRAQVSVAASSGDWSKRIRDMQYTDHDDYTVGHRHGNVKLIPRILQEQQSLRRVLLWHAVEADEAVDQVLCGLRVVVGEVERVKAELGRLVC